MTLDINIEKEIWKNSVSRAGKEKLRSFLEENITAEGKAYKILSKCKNIFDERGYADCIYKHLAREKLSDIIMKSYIELGNFLRKSRVIYYIFTENSKVNNFFKNLESIIKASAFSKYYNKYVEIKNVSLCNGKSPISIKDSIICIRGKGKSFILIIPVFLTVVNLKYRNNMLKQLRIQFVIASSGRKVSVFVRKSPNVLTYERLPKAFRILLTFNSNGILELRCLDSLHTKYAITIGDTLVQLLKKQFSLGKYVPLSEISNTLEFKERALKLAQAVGVIKFLDSEGRGFIVIGEKRIPFLSSRIARRDILKYLEEAKNTDLNSFLRRNKVVSATIRILRGGRYFIKRYDELLDEAYKAWVNGEMDAYRMLLSLIERLSPLYFTINFNYGYTHFFSSIPETEYVNVIHPLLLESLETIRQVELYKKILEVLP